VFYENTLNRGNHCFTFYSGKDKYYLLTGIAGQTSHTIKMLNANTSRDYQGKCKFVYDGNCDDVVNNKSLKDINDFVFSIGDELKFTAYSGIGEVSIMDSPEGDHIYDFQFAGIPCPGTPTVTDIDGNVYNTVLVGSQCWMKENLKTMTYNNGTPIQNLTDSSSWNNYYTPGYVWYDNDISWKDLYGALYNWNAANDTNGLCPAGWHVPTHDEWTMLTDFIGGISTPKGNELKSCRQVNSPLGGNCNTTDHPRWNESSDEWGTDAYGFSGLPGGFRDIYGGFNNIGTDGLWWSATEAGLSVYHRGLYYNTGTVHISTWAKRNGFSVRCVKNILN
jgi:uncharacterized protein (TIGR02145 family)